MSAELKPCPFCGGEADINPITWSSGFYNVSCFNGQCQETRTWAETRDEAIAAWNIHAVDPATIREAALREAADVVYKWWFEDGNELPQELILALIGEKK